jgi:hypothetical protein
MVIAPKKAVTALITYAHAPRILSNIDLPPTKQKPGAWPGSYSFALLGNILIRLFSTHKYGFTASCISGHYQEAFAYATDPFRLIPSIVFLDSESSPCHL